MLTHSYFPYVGGAERQIQALAPRLRKKGVEVYVVTRQYKQLASFEEIQGIPVYRIPAPGTKPVAAMSYILRSIPLLTSIRPDILHAHDLLSPTTAAILAGWSSGIPVVAKVLRGGILGDIHKLKNRALGRARLWLLRKWVNTFIVISREIDSELSGVGISYEQRLFLPNGVDVDRFTPLSQDEKRAMRAKLALPEDGYIIIYSGRLSLEKRVEHLLTVWPKISEGHPNALLIVAGTGDQEVRLRSMAGQSVRFLGHVDEPLPYLQSSDMFVLPSITEGLSNSLLEALSVGLPVVATEVGGTPDVIEHGTSGFIVPPDDVQALLDAILGLMDSPELQLRISREGRARVLQHYSLDAVAENMSALYFRLAKDKPI